MQYSALSQQLVDIITTRQQAVQLVGVIDDVLQHEYTLRSQPRELLKKSLPFSLQEKLLALFPYDKNNTDDAKKIFTFLKEIVKEIKTLPSISLTLAIEPTEHMLETVKATLKRHTTQPLLLDISVQESLIGGAIVAFQGKYLDESLKHRLEQGKHI